MACSARFSAALEETEISPDGVKMYTWRAVRRQQLQKLRKQIRWIVFFMALVEVQRVGLMDIIFQGKYKTREVGAEDYGISYTAGYLIAWLFAAVWVIFYVPLFSWWLKPSTNEADTGPSKDTSNNQPTWLSKFNNIILPINVALYLSTYIYHLIETFVHVGPKPYTPTSSFSSVVPTKKAWGIRALLFSGICTSLALGKYVFMVLELCGLAKVKFVEYLVIVVPVQINLGILLASLVQGRAERRAMRKREGLEDVEGLSLMGEKGGLIA